MVAGYDNDSPFLALALKLGSSGQVRPELSIED